MTNLKVPNNERFAVGTIHKMRLDGDVVVLEWVNNKKILVKFVLSGYQRYAEAKEVISGSIRDKMRSDIIKKGDIFASDNWGDVEVLEYVDSKNVIVRFIRTTTQSVVEASQLRKGSMRDPSSFISVGEVYPSNNCGDFEILEKMKGRKSLVRFLITGHEQVVGNSSVRRGTVKDPYYPSVCGVGFVGEGSYPTTLNRKGTPCYSVWRGILRRCYDESCNCYHWYGGRGVTVHESWWDFQVFANWYEINYREGYQLDKDLKVIGSTMYSPSTCSFVPSLINKIISTGGSNKDLPIGVLKHPSNGKFTSQLSINGVSTMLGQYNTPEAAFLAYKSAKKCYIREIAEKHYAEDLICREVYDNLMDWEIEPYPSLNNQEILEEYL